MALSASQQLDTRPPTKPVPLRRRSRWTVTQALTAYGFVLPSLIGVGAFLLIPVLTVGVVSLFHWDYLTPPKFVGLSNYADLLGDGQVRNSFAVTAYYVLLNIPAQTALALFIAVQLNKRLRGRTVFRGIYLLPWLATPVAMGIVFQWIFDPRNGALNNFLGIFGIAPIAWLSDPHWAMPAIAMVNIWQYTGYTVLFFLAGLQGIPEDIYEAARLDGAGPASIFFRITLPLLAPTMVFVLVTSIIGSFQVFDTVAVMTQGGPGDATRVVNYLIYEKAFKFFDAGSASALSMLLFLVLLAVTIAQFLYFRNRTTYDLS
jgi:multiple sugar transport system permease protein